MTVWPFMALADSGVTDNDQIAIAKQYLVNVDAAWRAAQTAEAPFYIMCALLEKESMGKNIYGHDIGGYFSAPGEHPVTQANFAEFYYHVVTLRERSNGVGPMQITYRGFFPQMKQQGLDAWVPYDNMLFGIRLFMTYYDANRSYGYSESESIRRAGVRYNGATSYGDRLLVIADKWKARLDG